MSRPVLLIAGGSRGIGASTAKLAGARGYDVAVNYNNNANAAAGVVAAVKAAGGNSVAIQGDMAIEADIERVTPMLPMGRAGQPDEVAEAILFLLSDSASYVNGANLRVSGAR